MEDKHESKQRIKYRKRNLEKMGNWKKSEEIRKVEKKTSKNEKMPQKGEENGMWNRGKTNIYGKWERKRNGIEGKLTYGKWERKRKMEEKGN